MAVVGGSIWAVSRREAGPDSDRVSLVDACDVDARVLERIWNGYVEGRSGDILAAELLPNQFGTRHSTPYAYTQDVPIVLYGPGYINDGVTVDRDVTVADLAPTFAELLGYADFPQRDGRILREALLPPDQRNGTPKVLFTVVWDGGGDNVLERWPDSWPHLKELIAGGTQFTEATVGSSPSITPSVHATIGTGSFPRSHGLSDTRIRIGGKTVDAWEGTSPQYLDLETLGDLWDRSTGNEALVGMMARDAWHLGMIGHGAYLDGADHDIAIMDELGGVDFRTNPEYYSMPDYVRGLEGLSQEVTELDVADGKADLEWLGNPLLEFDGKIRYTPAWSDFQTEKLVQVLTTEGFGADATPDLFYVNYKSTDLAGHEWNMVEEEVRDNLIAQDEQLPTLTQTLDEIAGPGNWVMALTADHGMTPYPTVTRGWSIETRDLTEDIEAAFDKVTPDKPIVLSNRGYQFMLNRDELRRNDVTAEDIAEFIRDYRIEDNLTPTNKILPRFEDRTNERLYMTALTPEALRAALDCATRRGRL